MLDTVTKTAKFTEICKTTDKVYKIYSNGCKKGPSKELKIVKITIHENCKINWNLQDQQQNLRNFTLTIVMVTVNNALESHPVYKWETLTMEMSHPSSLIPLTYTTVIILSVSQELLTDTLNYVMVILQHRHYKHEDMIDRCSFVHNF